MLNWNRDLPMPTVVHFHRLVFPVLFVVGVFSSRGAPAQSAVGAEGISDRPTHFGGEPLTHMTGIWYGGKWAPEVISTGGEDYLAGYGRGLWVARLKWVEMTTSQAKAHAGPILEKVRAGRAAAEERRRERKRRKESAD